MKQSHYPVMLAEMLDALSPRHGGVYLDATFGGGGYTHSILESTDCQVYALDRDPEAIMRAKELVHHYGDRFKILEGAFHQLEDLCTEANAPLFDGIVFDFGVSSYQIDQPERGFSFRFEGPLDMRMSHSGQTAADVVNTFDEEDIAEIIYRYGDEKRSRQIARKIIERRRESPLTTTTELANLVKEVVRSPDAQHPATRTFQALRIFVNDELSQIDQGLRFSEKWLSEGGRLVTITFHSLEDRLVKASTRQGPYQILERRGIAPSAEEIALNGRSRSARLRVAEKRSPHCSY